MWGKAASGSVTTCYRNLSLGASSPTESRSTRKLNSLTANPPVTQHLRIARIEMDKRLFYSVSLSNYHVLERFWKERGMFFALESSHCTSCRVLLDICSSALQQAGEPRMAALESNTGSGRDFVDQSAASVLTAHTVAKYSGPPSQQH